MISINSLLYRKFLDDGKQIDVWNIFDSATAVDMSSILHIRRPFIVIDNFRWLKTTTVNQQITKNLYAGPIYTFQNITQYYEILYNNM